MVFSAELHGESRNTDQIHGDYRNNTHRIQIHTPKPKNYTNNANHMHKTYENVRAAFGRPTKGAGAFGARPLCVHIFVCFVHVICVFGVVLGFGGVDSYSPGIFPVFSVYLDCISALPV